MLTASGDTLNGLRHECSVETELIEHVSYHVLYLFLIVCNLHCIGKLPVDFKLLHYVVVVTCAGKLGLDSPYFLVAHFHFQAVVVQYLYSLFQSRSYRAVGPLPVLFLQFL